MREDEGARRGCFVVLEGIDGCGSTTQARLLVDSLRDSGRPARFTCEPSDGPIGRLIRSILEGRVREADGTARRFDWPTLGLLFAADRHDHADATIRPALRAGEIVVSDRYALSTVAYQCGLADGEASAAAWLRELNARVLRPDLTLVLDVSAELAEQRRAARGGPEELLEKRDLQRRLVALYARAEQLVPLHNVAHVDATGPVPEVRALVAQAVARVLS